MMFSPDEKTITEILKLYQEGKSTAEIAEQFHVSRSSVYRWINSRTKHDLQSVTKLSEREFYLMRAKLERLEKENEIFYACSCGRNSPLEEKYDEITRLKDKYGIHALCRVLNVNRSAYYHHFFRSPEKTQIELEDEKLRPMIKEIFEHSQERFGSRKI
ncbi:MAG: helix-turn-helix domain-containing protein [Treponema sp.]|nr:helix-turn-helix domain-containing protein [Treponema sp.]